MADLLVRARTRFNIAQRELKAALAAGDAKREGRERKRIADAWEELTTAIPVGSEELWAQVRQLVDLLRGAQVLEDTCERLVTFAILVRKGKAHWSYKAEGDNTPLHDARAAILNTILKPPLWPDQAREDALQMLRCMFPSPALERYREMLTRAAAEERRRVAPAHFVRRTTHLRKLRQLKAPVRT
jgi:hypothetical protein